MGVPFIIEEHKKLPSHHQTFEMQQLIRESILRECPNDCKGPDILYCGDCGNIQKTSSNIEVSMNRPKVTTIE